jgi:glyoxylase I family protein
VEFDHVGIPVPEKREGMRFLEAAGSWLTSPADHPFRVQFLYFPPESGAPEAVRTRPHVAYRVDDLDEAVGSRPLVAGPIDAFGTLRVAFVEVDGALIEFVQAV